jgi:hypothetical protein
MTNFVASMAKTRTIFLVLMAISLTAVAQKKKKKEAEEKIPVYNYVIDDPMDVFGRQAVPAEVSNTVLVPEFFSAREWHSGDTLLKMLCYNAANELIRMDTITDYRRLRYVSLMQYYTEQGHTYKDAEGKIQPLPVEKIIYRYDKTGNDKWFSVDYASRKSSSLQEFVNEIVKTDTVKATDPVLGNAVTTIYRHYKVSQVK